MVLVISIPFRMALAGWGSSDSTFPEIKGWKLIVEEKVYTAENLWDVIDGAADLFL